MERQNYFIRRETEYRKTIDEINCEIIKRSSDPLDLRELKQANLNSEDASELTKNIERLLNNSNIERMEKEGIDPERLKEFKTNFLDILKNIEKVQN